MISDSELTELARKDECGDEGVVPAATYNRDLEMYAERLRAERRENERLKQALKDIEMAPRVLAPERLVEKMQNLALAALINK